MLLTSFYKQGQGGTFKAEIHQDAQGYVIEYYAPNGAKLKSDQYPNTSIHSVAAIAESWVNNAQVLNG